MQNDSPAMDSVKIELRELAIDRGRSHEDNGFSNNAIFTSHYSLLTFFPKNLLIQFHRIGNFWFLLISILMILPFEPTPVSSWSTIVPFSFVLLMNMIKDGISDYQRHKIDFETNNKKAWVWDENLSDFVEILWKNIEVGNILLFKIDEFISADCILLKCSSEICYVETSSLDGEDNLKVKSPVLEIASLLVGNTPSLAMSNLHYLDEAVVKTEHSNNRLHSFEGSIKLKSIPKSLQVALDNMILRGSKVKNTEWIIGLVVFTGSDTKFMQNTLKPQVKKSRIEKRMNKVMIALLGFILLCSIFFGAANYVITKNSKDYKMYDFKHINIDIYFVMISYLILFSRLAPIALYLNIDTIRILQAYYVNNDIGSIGTETECKSKAKTYDLTEELGQVEFIFTDKTGTLTYNQMELKKCSIDEEIYETIEDLQAAGKNGKIIDFIEHLALCHTVIPEVRDGITIYEAASQDEESLVQAAQKLGFHFISNIDEYYIVKVNGEHLEFKVIGINAYSAERKRMSIIIEPMSDKDRKPILLCKGADSTMMSRFNKSNCNTGNAISVIENFALNGLRILVMGKKELTFEEAEIYRMKYLSAKHALYNKEKLLNEIAEEIEVDMDLVGICGIEDKICAGVANSIKNLTQAGIKICVLTGDKPETAMSIAFSTKIFHPSIDLINISGTTIAENESILFNALKKHVFPTDKKPKPDTIQNDSKANSSAFDRIIRASALRVKKEKLKIKPITCAKLKTLNIGLIIDGESLPFIINNPELQNYFIMLLAVSQAVVVGRVSPQQKAQFVKLVKNAYNFKPCTLAIGDGANDVSMIQEADIGIGILGKEGSHAANSSDFAITEFQFLDQLVLVQGSWNYHRTCKVVLLSFFKNFLLGFTQFIYSFYTCYSGTGLYDSVLVGVYNVLFTMLSVVMLGILDKDYSKETIIKYPSLYMAGIYNRDLSKKKLIMLFVKSWVYSLCIFFIPYSASKSISPNGQTEDFYIFGTTIYISLILIVNFSACLSMRVKNIFFSLGVIINIGLLFPFLFIYDNPTNPILSNMNNIIGILFKYPSMILSIILVTVLCLFLELLSELIREKWGNKRLRKINTSIYEEQNNNKLMLRRAKYYRKHLPQIYDKKTKSVTDPTGKKRIYKFHKYSLKFVFPYIEKSYSLSLIEKNVYFLKKLLIVGTTLYAVWSILELIADGGQSSEIVYRAVMFVVGLIGIIFSRFEIVEKYLARFLIGFSSVILGGKIIFEGIFGLDGTHSSAIMYPTFCMFTSGFSYELIFPFGFFTIAQVVKTFIILPLTKFWMLVQYTIILIPLYLMVTFIGYTREKCNRLDFVLHKNIEYKYQKGHEILGNLLPGFVKERVKQGVRYIADFQSSVTVLFCDICYFDRICAMHNPNELLELLDRFFGLLDQLCDKHGVTKIETVNKTYMVCGGLKDSEEHLPSSLLSEHHAVRCVNLALEIVEKIENVHLKNGEKLKVKIGITTGPVIAGVVGEHKPQFSLVGDTVNTASRLCTTLDKYDCMQISDETYKYLSGKKYKIQENYVYMKGKGNTHTYIISSAGKRNINRRYATIEKFSDLYFFDKTVMEITPQEQEVFVDAKDGRRSSILSVGSYQESAKLKLNETTMIGESIYDIDYVGPIQWLVCSFSESKIQKEFRIEMITMNGRHLKLGMILFSSIYSIISIVFIAIFIYTSSHKYGIILGARVICIIILGINILKFEKNYKSALHPWFVMCVMTLLAFVSSISVTIVNDDIFSAIILEKMYIFTLTSHISGLMFGHILGAFSMDLITFAVIIKSCNHPLSLKLSLVFKLLVFYILELLCSLFLELQERKRFNINKFAYSEIKSTEKLLNQLIPTQVLKNLHHDITTTDRYFDVTIIYADICGFTAWSASKEPIEVISMLSKLFSNFDHLCVRHNVYKVHTIGDCYAILSFTDGDRRDIAKECVNIVEIALDMIKAIQKVNKRQKINLNMRIGMHTGEVIAGITGTNIVRYDIYGPDVEIANKMESSGEPGKINVSEVTKDLIEIYQPGRFDFIFNKKVNHRPTNRELESYYLLAKNV
ncbi:hypothetical protein SteCoe_22785 [Stentor coeruleus]|uniref:P-type phospholipid transporter n=1 Tax=Stentor coeruleus TaxID=5963 RepID=A0A1R2BLG4_9CILI|nr:hypothetical protein SteCoe_22785 [Stentor coeruleus]